MHTLEKCMYFKLPLASRLEPRVCALDDTHAKGEYNKMKKERIQPFNVCVTQNTMINYHIDLQFAHLITSPTHYSLVAISAICVTRFVIKVIDGRQTCKRPKDDSINKFNTYFNLITYIFGVKWPNVIEFSQPASQCVCLWPSSVKSGPTNSPEIQMFRRLSCNATQRNNLISKVSSSPQALWLYNRTHLAEWIMATDGGGKSQQTFFLLPQRQLTDRFAELLKTLSTQSPI